MSGWRLRVGSLMWLLIGCPALPQTAKQNCDGAGTMELSVAFDDSYSSAKLTYRFANPNAFSAAKIEVWDRPKMLFRAQVPVKARGETLWKPKEGTPDTPFELSIAVDDPN